MPWTPAQHRLFEAAAHNPAVAAEKGIKASDAKRMAGEGILPAGVAPTQKNRKLKAYGAALRS